jgi:hypothetical protein
MRRESVDRLQVRFGGLGSLDIAGLDARRLDVDVTRPNPCQVEVSGRAGKQHVSLSGIGEYDARELQSRKTAIALKGPGGHATVRAEDELNVTIGGVGRVDYYGQPRVTKKVSPLGAVTHLIDVEEVPAR